MNGRIRAVLDKWLHKTVLRRWGRVADQAEAADLGELRGLRLRARALRRQFDLPERPTPQVRHIKHEVDAQEADDEEAAVPGAPPIDFRKSLLPIAARQEHDDREEDAVRGGERQRGDQKSGQEGRGLRAASIRGRGLVPEVAATRRPAPVQQYAHTDEK